MKHIALQQEKTSALELKTFCSWSLNTVNVWYSEGGEIKLLGCNENGKKSLSFLLLCVLTELLCSRLIKAVLSFWHLSPSIYLGSCCIFQRKNEYSSKIHLSTLLLKFWPVLWPPPL